ncbi:MAG: hypothetical protein ACXWCU_10780 [Caldimonas sp.]
MRSTVCIAFGTAEVLVNLPAAETPWSADQARRWLDEQFVANDCEPLRATGKVLTVDKLLAIADAVGQQGFEGDEAFRLAFAHAAAAALSRPVVRIDVDARAVSF